MNPYKELEKITGYRLTDLSVKVGLTSFEKEVVENFYPDSVRITKNKLRQLEEAVQKYPKIKSLRNFLVVYCRHLGLPKKALKKAKEALAVFPDYFFGRVTLAELYLTEGKIEEAIQVFDAEQPFHLYMEREKLSPPYHLSLYISYLYIQGLFAIDQEDDLSKAKNKLGYMLSVASDDHPLIERLANRILECQINRMTAMLDEISGNARRVETPPKFDFPPFELEEIQHEVITELFMYEAEALPESVITAIAALPREEAIHDLIGLLAHAAHFYTSGEYKEVMFDEESMSYPMHIPLCLTALSAKEALPDVLNFFRQGEDCLDYWYSDWFEEVWLDFLDMAAVHRDQAEQMWAFLQETQVSAYAKIQVYKSLCGLAFRSVERLPELISKTKALWQFFQEQNTDETLIDTVFIESTMMEAAYLGSEELTEMLPLLFEYQLVSKHAMGPLDETQRIYQHYREPTRFYQEEEALQKQYGSLKGYLREKVEPYEDLDQPKDEMTRLGEDFLQELMTHNFERHTTQNEMENDFWRNEPPQVVPVRTEPKVGRNDPCPCGSGKKYKKCCWKK